MDKLGIILGLAALAVAGLAFAQVGEKDARIAELTQGNSDLKDQLTTLEVKLDAALGLEDPATPMSAAAATDDAATSGVGLATRAPTSPLARLAELEKTVKRQHELLAKLESSDKGADEAAGMVRSFMPKNFFHNTDAAAKALALDERQKSEMEDVLERAKSELKDLYAIENDEGVTWDQVRKPKMANLGGDGGSISIAMPDFGKINKFKKSRIPGSSETFGEAEKRIKDRAFGDVRRNLPADKAKTWDKAHKDGLLRSGMGGAFSISSVQIGNDK
jgi:hypothetical protein